MRQRKGVGKPEIASPASISRTDAKSMEVPVVRNSLYSPIWDVVVVVVLLALALYARLVSIDNPNKIV
jgi:hypothetical protein